jgi:hypothetical protein
VRRPIRTRMRLGQRGRGERGVLAMRRLRAAEGAVCPLEGGDPWRTVRGRRKGILIEIYLTGS